MSEIEISSNGWLAISLGNGSAGVFDLHDTNSWQYLPSESIVEQSIDNNLNRNLIKFSPNGQILVVNGQNKQLYVYIQIDFAKSEVWWKLEKQIIVRKPISALDLTNEFLLIADKNGDVYKVDLSFNHTDKNLIVTSENRIMEHLSVILDIAFIPVNDNKSFILTAHQDGEIRLNHYPNSSNSQGVCLGHTEFVSHIKLIDNHHFLSVSGDGKYLFVVQS
jgi:WD40 repeat protein